MMNKYLKIMIALRFLIALVVGGVAFFLIAKVTKYLYMPGDVQQISWIELIKNLWGRDEWYFRFLVIFNFILKPLFACYLVLVFFDVVKKR